MNYDCDPCSEVNCEDEIRTNARSCDDSGSAWHSRHEKAKLPVRVGFAHVGGVIIDNVNFPAEERFSEIKKIQRKVVVTQAKIVCHQLIVEGFVKKNIMYTIPDPEGDPGATKCCSVVRNVIKDIEVKVPFCFSTSLHGLHLGHLQNSHESEKVFLENTMGDNVCDEGIMGDADCAKIHHQFTPLNKPPFAELEAYSICELALNRHCCNDGLFDVFTEKFVLKLSFAIYVYKHCRVCHHSHHGYENVNDEILETDTLDNDSINDSEEEISEGLSRLKEDL